MYLFSLSQHFESWRHQNKFFFFHQVWPLKPVRELKLCFVSALCLCVTLPRAMCRVFIDPTTWQMLHTEEEETRSDLFSLFSLSLSLFLLPPHPPSLSPPFPLDPSQSLSLFVCLWTRDEAEMEYLKIAQDLDMYGVNYFLIRVSQCCFAVSLQSKPIASFTLPLQCCTVIPPRRSV